MVHRVFISYHHDNDQYYKETLSIIGESNGIFVDESVNTGEIDDNIPAETVRRRIRDKYLRDTTVTIVLVGTETKNRKHVDWEIYSSMYDGPKNKQSGILVVNLPSIQNNCCLVHHGVEEVQFVYPDVYSWWSIETWQEYKEIYPFMPARIIDNLVSTNAFISVTSWDRVIQPRNLRYLVDITHDDRRRCKYDMSKDLRRQNR